MFVNEKVWKFYAIIEMSVVLLPGALVPVHKKNNRQMYK